MMNEKEFAKYLLSKKDSGLYGCISLTYYTKGQSNAWYCDLCYYDSEQYFKITKKASGYGYDKQSTCVSNCLNIFRNVFKRYNKRAKKYTTYGLYDNNAISYGIVISAVMKCMKCFRNVKLVSTYNGNYESNLKYEIML